MGVNIGNRNQEDMSQEQYDYSGNPVPGFVTLTF